MVGGRKVLILALDLGHHHLSSISLQSAPFYDHRVAAAAVTCIQG